MAHEVTQRADGKAEMAAVQGVDVWHGLGQRLPKSASIEEWTEAAGMDWTIRKSKIMYYADRACKDLREDKEAVALVRSDTGTRLGIVSPDYQIVQPFEVLEFYRDLVAEAGFKLHTAGTLFGGKRYWALAQLKEVTLNGWDKVGGFYLLSSTADGSRATDGRETTVCVVCNNTLSMALGGQPDAKHGFTVTHRQRFNAEKVQKALGRTAEHFDSWVDTVNELSMAKISSAGADEFILKLLRPSQQATEMVAQASPMDSFEALLNRPVTLNELQEDTVRRPRGADTMLDLFLGAGLGATEKGRAGTAWGLVNAVTQYVDHHATSKTDSHRMDRAFWGSGDELKTEALTLAQQMFL